MMKQKELIHDNLRDTHWIGEVIDNADPLAKGRCRVKVFGKFDKLPNEAIPWASPMNRVAAGSHMVPRLGDIIAVRFDNGDLYHPEYWFQVDQNADLKADVLDNAEAPHNVISLVYDAQRNFRLYFSPEDGLVMTTGDSNEAQPMIRFSPDGEIFINSDNIYIAADPEDTAEPAVKGKTLANLLSEIITQFNAHTHPTGVGPSGPPLPPQLPSMISLQTKINSNEQEGSIQQTT
jgi:hypothetical protein